MYSVLTFTVVDVFSPNTKPKKNYCMSIIRAISDTIFALNFASRLKISKTPRKNLEYVTFRDVFFCISAMICSWNFIMSKGARNDIWISLFIFPFYYINKLQFCLCNFTFVLHFIFHPKIIVFTLNVCSQKGSIRYAICL